jgi:arabinofuranosyltransferase
MRFPTSRLVTLFFISAIILLFSIQVIDYLNFGVDDVFISMRVAENAANGNGPFFNANEHVEGYSNPLWVALLASGSRLLFNDFHSDFRLLWFAKILSFIFGIGVFIFLYLIVKKYIPPNESLLPMQLVVILIAVSCGSFVLWCCGGMETTLTAFLFTFSIFLFQKVLKQRSESNTIGIVSSILFSFVLVLSALTRPEPILNGIAAIIFFLFIFRKDIRWKHRMAVLLPMVIIFSSFLFWRYITFDDLLPNTFYAKTGGGLKSYFLSTKYLFGGIFFIGGPFLLSVLFISWKKNPLIQYCLLLILVSFFFILYSGGDWMAGYRFFIPVAPAFFLLMTFGISSISQNLHEIENKRISKLSGFVILLAICSSFAGRMLIRGEIPIDPAWSSVTGHSTPWDYVVGDWIHQHASKNAVVATNEIGLIGYMNPSVRIIDLGGLSDKHIAKQAKRGENANADYVLNQKPDYITLPANGETAIAITGEPAIKAHAKPDPLPTFNYCTAIAESESFLINYHLEKRFPSLDLYARNQ